MSDIPDFTDSEHWTFKSSLDERWGKDAVIFELVNVGTMLDPSNRELTEGPAVYWHRGDRQLLPMENTE